jgi:signal peptidase I
MLQTLKEKLILFWKGWGLSILIAVVIATSFRSAIADWNDVPTGSMIPTIWEGDRIFVNKLAYDFKVPYTTWHLAKWGDPERGDIVVFFSPADGKRLVKRVIGLPGDEIALWKNQLVVNGVQLEYEAIPEVILEELVPEAEKTAVFFSEQLTEDTHPVMFTPNRPSAHTFAPVTIPKDHYFMMGDNRDNSADSRFFGFVERKRIVGRATRVVLSLDYEHYYLPRWDRFFQPLL